MATVQIKGVPEATHAELRRRAAEAHQSLQEYLRAELTTAASARHSRTSASAPMLAYSSSTTTAMIRRPA